MRGVRALLLDLDGVIVLAGKAIPGAAEALAELERRGAAVPDRDQHLGGQPRDAVALVGEARRADPARALRVGAVGVGGMDGAALPRPSLYVLASDDAKTEFAGQRLLSHEEAGRPARPRAVVIGDSPEEATFDNLNRAFRLIRRGATLVGMHRNPWWLTPDGPTLDSGSFVVGLEFATETRATVIGKPSPAFFAQAVRDLRDEVGRGPGPRGHRDGR